MIGSRHELLEVTELLVKEYEAILSAGWVLSCVAGCRNELLLLGLSDGFPDRHLDVEIDLQFRL